MSGSRGIRRWGVVLPFAAWGCGLLGSFERPTLTLQTVRLAALGLSGGRLDLVLDVHNPNGFEIRSTRLEAELELEGTRFGDATLDRDVVLAPGAHTTVEIPLTFTWEGVGAGARALLQRGELAYTLDTRMFARFPGGDRPVAVKLNGRVTVVDLVGFGR